MSEKVIFRQKGAVSSADLPKAHLRDIRLRLRHQADEPEDDVAKALRPVLGKGRVIHYKLVLRGMTWRKKSWHVLARAGRHNASIQIRDAKPSQLRDLVEALATVPGASDLQLKARRRIHP